MRHDHPYTGASNYFTRGGNDVRVAMRLCRPAGARCPCCGSTITVTHGQFDSRL